MLLTEWNEKTDEEIFLQREQTMRKVLEENQYVRFLGIEIIDLREGYCLARMKNSKELLNPYGMFHGGSLYSLADIAAGTAACMSGHYVTTVSGTINFLLPAEGTEYVYCEAEKLRIGGHIAVFDVRLKDEEGNVLDSGEFTFYITGHKVQAGRGGTGGDS